jgi:PAS domain S-box-containing protein
MEPRGSPSSSARQVTNPGTGHAPSGGDARRVTLVSGASLVLVGLLGLLGWLTGLRQIASILPQYAPIALYAAAFFVAAGCILLWHANRAWSPVAYSIATVVSIVISLTGMLTVAEYFTGSELTLESLIVPAGELRNGLPAGHLSPVGGAFFALLAPTLWLGLRPGASARSRQWASLVGLSIALAGGVMTLGYLMGEPLLYGGNIIPVAALAALGFAFLGAGLSAAAGNDVAPLRFLTGDSLRARLLRLFLPLSVGLAVVQATASAAIAANMADPAALTAAWSIGFLIVTGALVTYAASALGKDYDMAQMERRETEEELRETRDYLENLLGYANAPIIVWDPEQRITRFNHAFEDLAGRAAGEVVGKHLELLFPEDERRAQALQLVTRASVGERWRVVEIPILRADGQVRTVLWNSATLYADDGTTPVATIAQGQDITERKEAEDALRWDLALEAALAALYEPLVSSSISQAEMAHSVLEQARALTGSEHGYVSAVDPGAGESLVHASTKMTVDGCEVATSGRDFKLRPGKDGRYPALWGEALNTREAFFTNTPPAHPAAGGLPAGHLPLSQFLSVPVLLGSELVGQIALANPGRDYTDRDLQAVRRMGEFYALAIQTQRASTEVLELNARLEQRVRERTQELEASSRELEAFSYSVSHDLRAPLRGVDGWSLALLEDYGETLDEQAKVYLDRVRSETQRMGLLIDDLMKLSRVTRSEMQRRPVNLSAQAKRIAERLKSSQPQRSVEWIIQPDLMAEGDARLLEIALENLLANAWKFTAKRGHARITFGRVQREDILGGEADAGTLVPDHGPVFFVRDNGTGFSMAHANRLFSPFQRLHKSSEFAGTGIGLATVARIVRRHGGRIWTDAAVDQGATFYFTL